MRVSSERWKNDQYYKRLLGRLGDDVWLDLSESNCDEFYNSRLRVFIDCELRWHLKRNFI